jgi:hypothetical protein
MTLHAPGRRARIQESNPLPRRGLRRAEAALYIGVSPSKFDQLVGKGSMPKPKHVDGCVIWDVRALDLAFDALTDDDGEANPWD